MTEAAKFGFVPVASSITPVPPTEIAGEIQLQLAHFGAKRMDEENITVDLPIMFLVLTGGTEEKVLLLWNKRRERVGEEPVLLAAHPSNNSLPASLEVLARIHQEGSKGKILLLDETSNKECWNDLARMMHYYLAFYQIKKTKIGLIGNPSDWLVASMPDSNIIKKVWGTEVIRIELREFEELIENVNDAEIESDYHSFVNNSAAIREPSRKEIKQVVKVYAALNKLVHKYNLNALSVRCFDLVLDMKTTGCYALAKLNDIGIPASCEGDLVSTIGMIWGNAFTNQPVWMANPSRVDLQHNSILLAHCTVPTGMVSSYKLRSHFESGLGVGIEGDFSKGKATLFRIGGSNLNRLWISNAEITETGSEENLCRTQVTIKLHGAAKVSDLLTEPLGNHLLLLRGTYAREMEHWFDLFIG